MQCAWRTWKYWKKGVNNYNERIFLESFHSVKDNRAINEHKTSPECYLTLMNMMQICIIAAIEEPFLVTCHIFLTLKKVAVSDRKFSFYCI